MAQPDKDDLADALARMTSGEESEPPDDAPPEGLGEAPATPAPTLFRKPSSVNASEPVESVFQSRKADPSHTREPIALPMPATAPHTRPAAPPRRPATPNLTPPGQAQQEIVNLSRPAPPPRRAGPPPVYKRLGFRRTMIPILLTLGVMLPALGSLPFIVTADSPFSAVTPPVAITFIAIGVILLLTAVANMIQVKHEMSAGKP